MTSSERGAEGLLSRVLRAKTTPLRALSTLEVGGAPLYEAEVNTDEELRALTRWARARDLPLYPLGAGSNVLCADEALHGVIVHLKSEELDWSAPVAKNGPTIVTAGAGLEWDQLVQLSVDRGLAGVECLSGIPGKVGAAPIQNIGAYGQSLSDSCVGVKVYDSLRDELSWWEPQRCEWGYRTSAFKRHPRRFMILKLRLALYEGGAPTLSYAQLREFIGSKAPSLSETREAVLSLRRSKSMVYDPRDPNHRSAGSFFLNPVLSPQELRALDLRAEELELPPAPRWPEGLGFKVPAAWLIERAGCPKGYGEGRAGLSSQHCLALINRGEARAQELIDLARELQQKVKGRFDIWLKPEVNLWGFQGAPLSAPLSSEEPLETSWGSRRPRVALASCGALPPWESDDEPLHAELLRRGVEVSGPWWDDPLVEWGAYDLVIPRTTWNYQESPEAFRQWLTQVEAVSALSNSAEVIRWNLNKGYLRDLEALDALTPPTLWLEQVSGPEQAPSPEALKELCEARGWAKAFLKPTLAANAWGTHRLDKLDPQALEAASAHLQRWLPERGFILQPYYEGVEVEGELSMIFFGGRFSHAVQKLPQPGDYRVQDDHGATDQPWAPPEAWIKRSQALLESLPHPVMYARVDCLRAPDGEPHLIELELIEPSLFFRHDPLAPARFAEVICAQLKGLLKTEAEA